MTEIARKFWGAMAPTYDFAVDDSLGRVLRPAVRERLGKEHGLGRVVEFGCGTGYYTETLARAGDSVVATDFCGEMLALAADRLKGVPNVTLQNEDCVRPSFADATFDTAFMSLVLNLVDDPATALVQISRILKPDGTLFVAIPDWEHLDQDSIIRAVYRLKLNYDEAGSKYPITGTPMTADDLFILLRNADFGIASFEIIKDVSDPSGTAIDLVKAIKGQTASPAAGIPRTVIEVGGAPIVIEIKQLVCKYGKFTAVFNVSFNVLKGEIFALLGPNGAGKTTIVEVLEYLKTPTRGFVSILGDAMMTGFYHDFGNPFGGEKRDYEGIKERIGVLPQSFNTFDRLTVYENLDYYARLYAKHVDVDHLIDEMGLAEKRNVQFRNLSGGLKQRVGFAIALVNDPEIVFLDEPTAGLDPRARRDVWDIVRSLKAKGKTVVLTTHYMDEAYHLADHICVVHRGNIVAEGSPAELIDRYGGGDTLVVRECGAAAGPLLAALPGGVADGGDVRVRLPGGDGAATIVRAAAVVADCGVRCRELYVQRPTLDEVFLNLTGEKLRGGHQ
ncbi:MAG TPA: ATP-binding cassette domain-containing protein [Methanocella sp.]|nr:ATP-binding cassette domain-containing protein [Methanocella sp.]